MDWGLDGWGIYGVVGLGVGYGEFRKGEGGLICRRLGGMLGNKVEGGIGRMIDVVGVLARVVGVGV
ncbi:BCCT family transporter [Staphylococcus saprophyticus]|uniref:BCCT family transporter n=1 Tax=Staphylococcus saprophyticus TaxID=29385 RepID=UPI001CDA42F5|nr:BCCT family transporter [Staphylococcus saprophyticus]